MEVEPHQLDGGGGHGPLHCHPGLGQGEAELALCAAGGHVGVGMGVYPRRYAEEHLLPGPGGRGHPLQQGKLVEVVHHDAADAPFQGQLQLAARLVVAVEVDVLHGEAHRVGDGELAAGDGVEAQPLLGEEAGQGAVYVGLGGVDHQRVGVAISELPPVLGAATAERRLVEDVERRAELGGEGNGIAAPDDQVAAAVYAGARREQGRREQPKVLSGRL